MNRWPDFDGSGIRPVKVTIAIVTDEGTVFEAEGLAQIQYDLHQDYDSFFAGGPVPRQYITWRGPRLMDIAVRMRDFEGSITIPHEEVGL